MLGTTMSSVAGSIVFLDLQSGTEAHALDVEVFVDRFQLLAKRDEVFLAAQQPAEQAGQLHDQHARRFRLRSDQRRDRRQRVEQEVRIDLAGERLDARRHQQLLLFLQAVLDAGAVPDLDRHRDAQHRREQSPATRATGSAAQVEEALGAEAVAERLPDDLEADRRGQQDHDPVDLEPPHQLPDVAVQVGEEERREVPDRFLRADLAQAAAGESAADGEGQRDPLAGDAAGTPTIAPTIAPA